MDAGHAAGRSIPPTRARRSSASRGLWFNYGSVNGIDFWNTPTWPNRGLPPGWGRFVHRGNRHARAAPAAAG